MKCKLLLFAGTSGAFSAAVYLVFLLFDLISGGDRESEVSAIKFAVLVGVLSSGFTVFFTGIFDRKKMPWS